MTHVCEFQDVERVSVWVYCMHQSSRMPVLQMDTYWRLQSQYWQDKGTHCNSCSTLIGEGEGEEGNSGSQVGGGTQWIGRAWSGCVCVCRRMRFCWLMKMA